ncbi:MAG TPA: hypothetical protein VHF69_14680 [Candidatus Synoicihabitans sp.]|nr:hypothetical protein [Candidatus Synoicihabitans sp.]
MSDKDGPDKELPDKDLPDEQQLEEYLRGGSAVSRQYRQLPSTDVPAEIDRLVLRQAQEAVKSRPAKSRTWMRWTAPLALAASAVLVVSIVIESGVHKESYVAAPASAPVEMATRQETAEQPTAASAADNRALHSEDSGKRAAAAESDSQVVHVVPVAPEAMLDTPPAPFMPAPKIESPPPPDVPVLDPAPQLARERVNAISQTATAAPPPAPTESEQIAEMRTRGMDMAVQQVLVGEQRELKQTAGPRGTVSARSASDAEEKADEPRTISAPERWLRNIRLLRKENKHDEADREWRRFRSVYPNYLVAEDDAARGATR